MSNVPDIWFDPRIPISIRQLVVPEIQGASLLSYVV